MHPLCNRQLRCNPGLYGKLAAGGIPCHHVSSNNNSRAKVLYLTDRCSGIRYLIDTGAGLSVLPPEEIDKPHKGKGKNLRAANGSEIATYGERAVEIDFGFGRTYNRVFHVADVTAPILGIDILAACKSNINVHNASVTDKCTNVSIRANSAKINNINCISSVLPQSSYLKLFNEFPALLSDKHIHPPKHNIVHRIRTTRGPVYCRPRRLSPHISASVKPAFAKLLADGIISVVMQRKPFFFCSVFFSIQCFFFFFFNWYVY